MRTLAIIVTYNAMRWMERCLKSLFSSSIVPDLYIIDNGSTDGTQTYIKTHYPQAVFQQNKENLGFGKANNIGLQYAIDHQYDYVYLMNQDAWVLSSTIETLLEVSRRHPEYGILSPFQLEANMQHLDQNFKANTCSVMSCPDLLDYLYIEQTTDVLPVNNTVMAAHWLMSIRCIKKVGGFSPTFQQYGEDNNYLGRVRYHGFKVGLVPSAKGVHDREYRVLSKEKRWYLRVVAMKTMLSHPQKPKHSRLVVLLYMTLLDIYKNKSVRPLVNLCSILMEYSEIRSNRRLSTNTEGAFLNV